MTDSELIAKKARDLEQCLTNLDRLAECPVCNGIGSVLAALGEIEYAQSGMVRREVCANCGGQGLVKKPQEAKQ